MFSFSKNKLGIIGGGAFGTSLSIAFSDCFEEVIIHTIEKDVMNDINDNSINTKYLDNYQIPSNVISTMSYEDISECAIIIIAIPTQHIHSIIKEIFLFNKDAYYLVASKGIDIVNKSLISDVITKKVENINLGIISGPSFAKELAQKMVTTLLLAMRNEKDAKYLSKVMTNNHIRMYYSDDIIGSQIGGAIKNVIAIATGISFGFGFGHNAMAGLITRGLREMSEVNNFYKGSRETIYGISGLGDLVLTATSTKSRNYSLGYAIGKQGYFSEDLISTSKGTCEGYYTVKILYEIVKENSLNMPITKEVFDICYQGQKVENSLKNLLSREIKTEL